MSVKEVLAHEQPSPQPRTHQSTPLRVLGLTFTQIPHIHHSMLRLQPLLRGWMNERLSSVGMLAILCLDSRSSSTYFGKLSPFRKQCGMVSLITYLGYLVSFPLFQCLKVSFFSILPSFIAVYSMLESPHSSSWEAN